VKPDISLDQLHQHRYPSVTGDMQMLVTEGDGWRRDDVTPYLAEQLLKLHLRELEERVGSPRLPVARSRRRWRRRSR